MVKWAFRALAGLCLAAAPVAANEPAPGSPERKVILDALRPAIEARLGPNVVFVVQRIESADGWAFVQAEPQRKGGGPINGAAHFPPDELEYMDGLTVTALLRINSGRWQLVDQAIGATDAWYCGVAAANAVTHCQ